MGRALLLITILFTVPAWADDDISPEAISRFSLPTKDRCWVKYSLGTYYYWHHKSYPDLERMHTTEVKITRYEGQYSGEVAYLSIAPKECKSDLQICFADPKILQFERKISPVFEREDGGIHIAYVNIFDASEGASKKIKIVLQPYEAIDLGFMGIRSEQVLDHFQTGCN